MSLSVREKIPALEELLKAQLLHRKSRNLSLTEAGQIVSRVGWMY